MSQTKGRVTIPTNLDVVPETIELMKRWGDVYKRQGSVKAS